MGTRWSGFTKVVAGAVAKAPPMTLRDGSATDLFPSDGTNPSARDTPMAPATTKLKPLYDAFPQASRDALWEHVSASGHHEAIAEFVDAAKSAGFSDGDLLFTDPEKTYALMRVGR